ncbi:MAG: ring-cleaving dioxygenase [Bacteroidota bacterium]
MERSIVGIHHITAMAGDAQQNVDFYVNILGLRLVKKSINQDAPDVYHLYYGDESGSPGTAITFFPFGRAARGTRGAGEISRVAFAVPTASQGFWISHLSKNGIHIDGPSQIFNNDVLSILDPDGMVIDLVFNDLPELKYPWKKSVVPVEHAIKRFYGVTMSLNKSDASVKVLQGLLGARLSMQQGNRQRFVLGTGSDEAAIDIIVDTALPRARQSAGSVHHIAWRVKDDQAHEEWQRAVADSNLNTTEIIDRFYFHSIYFREPGGILYEIATDHPGFTVDESLEELGSQLKLPPWYEPQRLKIEQTLPPIVIPEYSETR